MGGQHDGDVQQPVPSGDAKAIEAELNAYLIPNARMVPAGVVIVQRAQKGGFTYTFAG